METAMGAGTDSALSALARGGVSGDKLASARSPSAAPAPATRAARIGRAGYNVNTVLIHERPELLLLYARAQNTAVTALTAQSQRT
jgi:hypothetical protein